MRRRQGRCSWYKRRSTGYRTNSDCHPERSECFAKRSNHGVEGPRKRGVRQASRGVPPHTRCAVRTPGRARGRIKGYGVLRLRFPSLSRTETSLRMTGIVGVGVKDHEYFVYIVCSGSGTLYIGMTNSIYRRALEQKRGQVEGFASKYHCERLIYYESFMMCIRRSAGKNN